MAVQWQELEKATPSSAVRGFIAECGYHILDSEREHRNTDHHFAIAVREYSDTR
jgi:hypothetical protein